MIYIKQLFTKLANRKKVVALFLVCSTIFFIRTNLISEFDFEKGVWSHRGLTKDSNFEQNSIESIKNAIKYDAKGVELDVYFDENTSDFIVSHDYPYQKPNGKILLLDSVFKQFSNINYWLDFKNLNKISLKEIHRSIEKLESLIERSKVHKKNILIESTSLKKLKLYTQNNFRTSLWITPTDNTKQHFTTLKYFIYYNLGYFSSISLEYKSYNHIEILNSLIPINLWTINDSKIIDQFISNKNVKIILTDLNYYK